MAKFELVNKYKDSLEDLIPVRKTSGAAGYDFVVAEDIIIPPYHDQWDKIVKTTNEKDDIEGPPFLLDELADITKSAQARPTLVPTGVKCKLDEGTYLELSVRSSCPLKYWLVMANSEGIIDSDYYNNESNEGHIFFQLINLSPYPIQLLAGDCIGQGIIKPYLTTEDDNTTGVRTGGFGSTSV